MAMVAPPDFGKTRSVVDVGRAATRRLGTPAEPSAPDGSVRDLPGRMGRFVVLETLGEGGMGQVLAAYDPVLDRRVALKRLRRARDEAGRARLRREARAMARLAHPAVVAVHDVLELDGDVLVAMEYVQGQTLRGWLEQQPRSWQTVVDMLCAAGRGLAAAHAAGLVHRDFKPDNVLVGQDDRVQVTDFGLAITVAEAETPQPGPRPVELEGTLTRTGALLGTPRYMAPEQFAGEPADARSDQFAFCVTLYQALYDRDPFEGETLAAREIAVLEGQPRPPGGDRRVPGWLGQAVLRGLSRDPADRWTSMQALLAELSRERRRGRWLGGAGAVLAVAGLGWWSIATDEQRCTGAEQELASLWNEPRQQALQTAMIETQLPGAEDAWAVVHRGLDGWANRWRAGYTDACEAHARGEQSDHVLDQRMTCLQRQRRTVSAALRVLEHPDAEVLRRAPRAVGELPAARRCAQVDALSDQQAAFEDPALVGREDSMRDRMAELRAEVAWAGRFAEAVRGYDGLLDELADIPAPALRAELLYERGSSRSVEDTLDAAKADLLAAYAQAERAPVDGLKARIAAELIDLVPRRGLSLPDVDAWAQVALAIVERADPGGGAHGHVLSVLAKLRNHQGRHEEGLRLAREARGLYAEAYGPMHARVAVPLSTAAMALVALGRAQEAVPLYEAANERIVAGLGPGHVDAASGEYNLGSMEMRRGRTGIAREHFERALAIWERALGPEHTRVAAALFGLGWVHDVEGTLESAQTYYERALAIWEDHPEVEAANLAAALNNLALVLAMRGDPRGALTMLERSAEIEARSRGRAHPGYAQALDSMAGVHLQLDQPQRAEQLARESLPLLRASVGSEHPFVAAALDRLAEALRRQGRAVEAEPLLREVLAIAGDDPEFRKSRARLALVRLARGDRPGAAAAVQPLQDVLADPSAPAGLRGALDFVAAQLHADPGQARRLAERAVVALEQARADAPILASEVQHWLQQQ